jgi:hypothetical protein
MLEVRGDEVRGPRVEVDFEPLDDGSHYVVRGRLLELHLCLNCGSTVLDVERHADWHYGIAAGRPWGSGPPPGYRQ